MGLYREQLALLVLRHEVLQDGAVVDEGVQLPGNWKANYEKGLLWPSHEYKRHKANCLLAIQEADIHSPCRVCNSKRERKAGGTQPHSKPHIVFLKEVQCGALYAAVPTSVA